ncbi:unnamed protein product [Dicrocoelium dendriticum]|nr:unnamed protein product [Dicrocoelium dendriticum]
MPVSVFYSQHVLPQKPSSIQLDIKKTSFKKVGTFLKVMEDDGLISLLQVKPGVYTLKSISRDHSSLQDVQPFVTDDSTGASSQKSWPPGYFGPPTIEDVRIVTGPTASFFAQFGFRPNTCITQSESRNAVNSYVREHGLLRQDDPNLVRLDDLLVKLCDPKLYTEAPESTLAQPVYLSRLDHILSSIMQPMPVAYRITFPTEGTTPVLWRKPGKLPSIELSTAKKNGKRLTRITNLSVFGIDPDAFAKHLQLTLACSAGRVEDPQFPNSDIIRAQGWHDAAISKMLVETYGIKKQFINGYVEDPKKKRK